MNKRKLIVAALAVVLTLAICAIPLLVAASEATEVGYDLSRPGSSHNKTVSSAELLSYYLGSPLIDAEREYLELHGGLTLRYDGGISASCVAAEYDAAEGRLDIVAYEYSYTDINGNTVTWIPTVTRLRDISVDMLPHNDGYIGSFDGVAEDDSLYALVDYTLSVSVAGDDLSAIINKAFLDAPDLKADLDERNAEYARLKAEYDEGLISYGQYLLAMSRYEADYAIYTDYLRKKALYEEATAAYELYLRELEEYEIASERYALYEQAMLEYNSAYSEYRAYLDAMEQYYRKLDKYESYLYSIGLVESQLSVIDSAKVNMTMNRQVYSAIMGNLVSSVLENKDLITGNLVNVSEEIVDGAGRATENLRVLLQYYFSLTEQKDKYAYYTINYEAFRDNFTLLCQCLDQLYRNKRIRAELIYQNRDEKYAILVSQLAIIANALNDGYIAGYYNEYYFDSDYKIEKKTISEWLENKTYFDDTGTAVPLADGYPSAVEEPQLPETKTEPSRPEQVSAPIMPQEVDPPGFDAPTPVDKPTPPISVSHPGQEPAVPSVGEEILALVDAYESSELAWRDFDGQGFVYTAVRSVSKKVFNVSTATVVFCDSDGEHLYSVEVDSGSCADYIGKIPTKAEDASATYVFGGWMYQDGTHADLNSVESDMILYPYFAPTLKYYDITFIVDGEYTVLSLPYGADPTPAVTPEKTRDFKCEYVFAGWDCEIVAVDGDATYTAVFDSRYLMPYSSGKGGATVTELENEFFVDCSYDYAPVFDISRVSALCAESAGKGMTISSPYGRLTLSYSTVLRMNESGDTIISVNATSLGGGYLYSVAVSDAIDGLADSYRISASLPCGASPQSGTVLYYSDLAGNTSYVKYSHDSGMISFQLNTGIEYRLSTFYSLDIISTEELGLSLSHSTATAGENVTIDYTVPNGITVAGFYMVVDGVETPISGSSFIMPHGNVTVGVRYTHDEYKIVFMNGDKVISTAYYGYGQTVVPPKDPNRVNSAVFSYTFKGWSPEVGPAVADAVYVALYDMEYLPFEEPTDELLISDRILGILVCSGLCFGIVVLALIPSTTLLIVFVCRDRKRFVRGHRRSENG